MNVFSGSRGLMSRFLFILAPVSWAGLLVCLSLAGCASVPDHYREGLELMARGDLEASIERLSQALAAQPSNVKVRASLIMAKDRWVTTQIEQAERESQAGRSDAAVQRLRRVLEREPAGGDRVRQVLGAVEAAETARQQSNLLDEIDGAVARGELESARAKLLPLTRTAAEHPRVQRLTRALAREPAQRPTESALALAAKRKITLEFRDALLGQIFDVIGRVAGVNFVLDRDIKPDQKASINLRDTTIDAALHALLLTNQLERQELSANTILIYPNTAAKVKLYQDLSVRAFHLTQTDVRTVANSIRALAKPRELVVDEKQNMLIIRDNAEGIRIAERLIELHDVADAEVVLEVEVLEVSRNRLRDLGVSWPDKMVLAPLATTSGGALTLANLQALNASGIGATVSPLTLNARSELLDARVLANPKIRALNREKARVLIGNRVPSITSAITSTGVISESVSYLEVGLKLDVEPTIHMGNDVLIRMALEVSNIVSEQTTKSGTTTFTIGTRGATTTLRLRDGENQMLAGLISDEERASGSRVPGLGDLPIAGRLFGTNKNEATKSEIVLSITPRIVRKPLRPGADRLEFETGTEGWDRPRPGADGGGAGSGGVGGSGATGAVGVPVDNKEPARPATNAPLNSPMNAPMGGQSGFGLGMPRPAQGTSTFGLDRPN